MPAVHALLQFPHSYHFCSQFYTAFISDILSSLMHYACASASQRIAEPCSPRSLLCDPHFQLKFLYLKAANHNYHRTEL